jgi:hypothetical protein
MCAFGHLPHTTSSLSATRRRAVFNDHNADDKGWMFSLFFLLLTLLPPKQWTKNQLLLDTLVQRTGGYNILWNNCQTFATDVAMLANVGGV